MNDGTTSFNPYTPSTTLHNVTDRQIDRLTDKHTDDAHTNCRSYTYVINIRYVFVRP